ncbi:hypothetical protein [Streptacidiphilus sp. EB103A]|uniref:hypothetical protein n=1 Tax=Streptacidiphilus sp. EB103A TaxID=3156275 RepID=UPI003512B26F
MVGLAAQPDARGRLPRPRFHWRYGLGFVLLLCSLLALVAVGQFAGWIGSAHGRAQAEAAADYRASSLLLALRAVPQAGSSEAGPVAEAAYAGAVRRVGGQLLDARYGPAPGQVELTVRITGTSVGGALTGHRRTTVRHCYDFGWTGGPAAAVRSSTDCPPVAAGLLAAAGKAEALADRLTPLSGTAAALQADTAALLSRAKAAPGITFRESALPGPLNGSTVGSTVAAVSNAEDGCVFVELHAGVVTAWPAPLLAACTPARAAQAVQTG